MFASLVALFALALPAAAQQPAPVCQLTSLGQLAATPPPAVFVLGERRGTSPDQARAYKLAKKLAKAGPVTLALQAVHTEQQGVLDGWAQGQVPDEQLGAQLQVFDRWGTAPDRYAKLVRGHSVGLQVVAAGVDPTHPPDGVIAPQPPGYVHLLSGTMGDSPVPVELEGRFASMVAYTDHRVAARAVEAWDGKGYLVILADRLHVEGGKGIGWQAGLLTPAPVKTVLMTRSDSPCYDADLYLR